MFGIEQYSLRKPDLSGARGVVGQYAKTVCTGSLVRDLHVSKGLDVNVALSIPFTLLHNGSFFDDQYYEK